MPPTLSFADLLRRQRKAAGLTQEELAARAGMSAHGIADLEAGRRRSPRKDTVELLAAALALTEQERAAFEVAARQKPITTPTGTGDLQRTGSGAAAGTGTLLVGRAAELALIERHLAGMAAPLLVFAGEPGIGKTRLLREAATRARAQRWEVLEAGCHRRSGQEPYAPLLGALVHHLERRGHAQQRQDLRGCGWLVRLLPELEEATAVSPPSASLPPEQERRLMFAAVGRYLHNVQGPAGTLLVLDDLQWAGDDALDLLGALLRTPAERPIRVVAAYRDTEVRRRDALAVLLADLGREELAFRQVLDPLTLAEAAALLDALLPEPAAEQTDVRHRIVVQTGGIPYFLLSCAQALDAGVLTERGQFLEVPWSVAETIRQRMQSLGEDAQALLEVAALIGREVPRDVLLAVGERLSLSEASVLARLDEACHGRLLAEQGAHAYIFAHDLVREVVAGDVSAARRTYLHRTIAEMLERASGKAPAEQLAYHYTQAGDDERAIVYLRRAADQARAMYAHAQAMSLYDDLVARLDALARTEEAAQARESLAAVLSVVGRYAEALAALARACETYRAAGDAEGVLRTVAQRGWICVLQGKSEEGLAQLLPLLEATPSEPPSRGLATAYVTLAALNFAAGRFREQLKAAERAAELAQAIGDDHTWLRAVARVAQALHVLSRLDESQRLLVQEVVPRAEALGDLTTLWRALESLCSICAARGDAQELLAAVERGSTVAERLGEPAAIALFSAWRGDHAFLTGDWMQARGAYEKCLATLRPLADSRYVGYPLQRLGRLVLAQGDWDMARSYLNEAVPLARQTSEIDALRGAEYALAEGELLQERPQDAYARLAPLFEAVDYDDRVVLEGTPLMAWVLLELGRAAEAQALLDRTIAAATSAGLRPILAKALGVSARLAMQEERWQEAEGALEEALTVAHAMPSPYAEARALYVYGLLSARRGEPGQARERLDAALAICSRLGERLYAQQVERALVDLDRAGDEARRVTRILHTT